MDQSPTDLAMLFTDPDGGKLNSEGALDVNPDDDLMTDFVPESLKDYSNYFDITDFDFSLELDDSERSKSPESSFEFSGWFQHPNPVKTFKGIYNVGNIKGSFGKIVDSVSPVFFQHCCLGTVFPKAVLVKRISSYVAVDIGRSNALAYMQILMNDVSITDVSWSDGDLLTEKIQFRCKHMEIKYKSQNERGELGAPVQILNWTWTDAPRTS